MKKSLFYFILLLSLFLLLANTVFAQGDAGQPGEFLRYGVNARALGMGRAFTAVTDNANAIYWNPGGLYNIVRDGMSFTLMYSKLYESTSYNFAAFAVPFELFIPADAASGFARELKKWNLGFAYLALASDDYEVRTRENLTTGETFSDVQSALYFSVTRSLTLGDHRLGLGVNLKKLQHQMWQHESNVSAIDLGIKYQPPLTWLELGAMLQNLNSPDLKFTQGSADIVPFSARVGLALRPKTGQRILDSFLFSFDYMAKPPGKRDRDWFIGTEYDLMPTVYNLPIKIRFGFNSRENLSLGINLDLPNNIFYPQANQILPKLDWAYLPDQQNAISGLAERFSLDFSYTPFTSERWYKRGLTKFTDGKYRQAKEDFTRSIHAKNPRQQSFPLASRLRLGDIEVLLARDKRQGLLSAVGYYQDAFDFSKPQVEVDNELNHRSYLNYLQALMLKKRFEEVIQATTVETIWGNHPTQKDFDPDVIALRSWSYYFLGQYPEGAASMQKGQGYVLCDFLLGLIRLEEKNYAAARQIFAGILSSQQTTIPNYIFVYPFQDDLLLDDTQFLFAYAGYKIAQPQEKKFGLTNLLEFAEIQHLYPASDLNQFLQSAGQFELLVGMYENGGDDKALENNYNIYMNTIKQGFISSSTLIANLR